jgi:hypothetical protein
MLDETIPQEDGEENQLTDKKLHPIAQAVDRFVNLVEDTAICASIFIPKSGNIIIKSLKKHQQKLKRAQVLLNDPDPMNQILGTKQALDSVRHFDRISKSELPFILEKGLFLSLFSAFDAFTGDILTAIYLEKPELFKSLNRSMTISEMMKYESLESIQQIVLQNEIEDFRRKSYVEQFENLEARFGLKLRAFSRWPEFVECSQRRNLITHCDGIISDQYLDVCGKEGYKFEKEACVGSKLKLESKYFFHSCHIMMEVGIKLGHTLWRKIFPDQLKGADRHSNDIVYNFNLDGKWEDAQVIGEFINCQQRMFNDEEKRIAIINYAIALKFDNKDEAAKALLSKMDWSATSNDFKIAEAVLCDDFDKSAEIMKRIGKKGELSNEEAYHRWPLFRAFRQNPKFLETYEIIYGYPFVVELQKAVVTAEAKAEIQLETELHELEEAENSPESNNDDMDSDKA